MLVYDLGFYNGDDTDYYLAKGCNVVAVEANFSLWASGCRRFFREIKNGSLFLLNQAFSKEGGLDIPFYVHPEQLDQSTCELYKTEFWDVKPDVCLIQTIGLYSLFDLHGIPDYIKTDIEGFDYMVLEQLLLSKKRPRYLSFELSRLDYYKTFSLLYACGYTKFKLVNQAHNKNQVDKGINYKFGKHHSGFFGKDLFESGYMNFDQCLTQYMKYKELKEIDNVNLALGWLDIHAEL